MTFTRSQSWVALGRAQKIWESELIGNRFRIDSLLKRSQWQNRIKTAKIFRSSFGKMGKKFRRERGGRSVLGRRKASVVNLVMLRQSYPTETVLSNKITRNILVLSFKNSPRKVLGRRTAIGSGTKHVPHAGAAIKTKNLRILRKGKSGRERERERERACLVLRFAGRTSLRGWKKNSTTQ